MSESGERTVDPTCGLTGCGEPAIWADQYGGLCLDHARPEHLREVLRGLLSKGVDRRAELEAALRDAELVVMDALADLGQSHAKRLLGTPPYLRFKAALAALAPAPDGDVGKCVHCGADVWWSFPRPDDPCWECKRPVGRPVAAQGAEE